VFLGGEYESGLKFTRSFALEWAEELAITVVSTASRFS
jgi:hypothetical protein